MTSYIKKNCLKHRKLKFSQFYLLGLFLFESYIPYVELYLKLTNTGINWKFNSLPFIPNIYMLNQQFCKQRRWLYLFNMQRQSIMLSKALYGLYFLAFITYDQTLSWLSLPPIFLFYLQVSSPPEAGGLLPDLQRLVSFRYFSGTPQNFKYASKLSFVARLLTLRKGLFIQNVIANVTAAWRRSRRNGLK